MDLIEIKNRANELCKELTKNLYIISIQTKEISKCEDIIRWAYIMQTHQYYLVKSHVGSKSQITTQFTGIDNGHRDKDGKPQLFETSIYGYEYDGPTSRYSSWDEADEGHHKIVEMLTGKR